MSRRSIGSGSTTGYTDLNTRAEVLNGLIQRHRWERGAEIGVDSGKLTRLLLQANPKLRLIAVDCWPADYPDGPYLKGEGPERGEAKQQFKRQRFAKSIQGYASRVLLIDKPSIEAVDNVPDGMLDFVFLDADHSYEGVTADIEVWKPKVKRGGYLLGHDYSEHYFPGIVKAVNDLFEKADIMLMPDFIWAVRT